MDRYEPMPGTIQTDTIPYQVRYGTTYTDRYELTPGTAWYMDRYDPIPGTIWYTDRYEPSPYTFQIDSFI